MKRRVTIKPPVHLNPGAAQPHLQKVGVETWTTEEDNSVTCDMTPEQVDAYRVSAPGHSLTVHDPEPEPESAPTVEPETELPTEPAEPNPPAA